MNTRELTRREELCRSLNMDFDEAAELFSDETLESMQMAKVNGGAIGAIILAGCALVTLGIYAYQVFFKDDKPTPSQSDFAKMFDYMKQFPPGTAFEMSADSVVNGNAYGLKVKLNSEPTPTSGWHPPMVAPTN